MFGKNPKRGIFKSDGTILQIEEIFPTLQGEGPHVGKPAIFIRLGGCNLACDFCDTEFESFKEVQLDEIIDEVTKLAKRKGRRVSNLVVITGGEPFRQPLEKLCDELVARDFLVQIETNGTIFRKINEKVEIICSPKNEGNGYGRLRDDLLKRVMALKFLISDSNKDYYDVPDVGQSKDIPVYVQPMDEYDEDKNRNNLEQAKKLALEKGYYLSLQTHKILGLR
jgi:7-carboxy-7-deazaguanine synthase